MIVKRWRAARCQCAVLDAWSSHNAESLGRLEQFGAGLVRYLSVQGRDVLAHAARNDIFDCSSLSRRLARAAGDPALPDLSMQSRPLKTLARVMYRQQVLDTDLQDAALIYGYLNLHAHQVLDAVDHGYIVDALTALGRRAEATEHLHRFAADLRNVDAYTYLLANLLNPYTGGSATEPEWLRQVNAPLTLNGLEPVVLTSGEQKPFCRLACNAASCTTDGPLISVLMPVHESSEATDTAIQSILSQSWRNLELIVVDDASTRGARERLGKWNGRDPRMQIIYNDENRGAYCARNTAYERAKGEFVTVADKDDWHHPRKLEIHASDLVEHPAKVANIGSWSRVNEDLKFLVRYAPIKMSHLSLPSLFFRREPVKNALGYWDSVRKGADGEYRLRMQKVFGIDMKPICQVPLALSLISGENLSSHDFGLGYEHPDRTSYKQTYGHWHRRIAAGENPYVPNDPSHRPFPAPVAFISRSPPPPHFDWIVAMDLGADVRTSDLVRSIVAAGIDRDRRIGVMHLPDLMQPSRKHRPPSDWLNDMIVDKKVSRLTLTDLAGADLILVTEPRVLQYRSEVTCRIRPKRVFVVARHAPFHPSFGAYCPGTVSENARMMFNADPVWVPASREVRVALKKTLRRREIAPYDWTGMEGLAA